MSTTATAERTPSIDPVPFIEYARDLARQQRRDLGEADLAHVRFLLQLAGRERFSEQLIRTRIRWFITRNAGRTAA